MQKFWISLNFFGKSIVVMFALLLISAPITIPFSKTIYFIATHGEEIENFLPYTVEQCKIDFDNKR